MLFRSDPVFEKIDANLAKAIMSIGAVKGFEIGDGFDAARATLFISFNFYTRLYMDCRNLG